MPKSLGQGEIKHKFKRQDVRLIYDFWDLSNRKYISGYMVGV